MIRSGGNWPRRDSASVWILVAATLLAPAALDWGAAACGQPEAARPPEQTVFKADFEGSNGLGGWRGQGRLAAGRLEGQSLAMERPRSDGLGSSAVTIALPLEELRGCKIRATALVKGADISARPNSWNGVKFMLVLETPSRRLWPQAEIGAGSFAWQRVAFTTRVPADATNAILHLGLEQVTGKAWFDDVKITVTQTRPVVRPRAASAVLYKGHDLPRLRGAMISPNIDSNSLRVLGGDWNANVIRWQLVRQGRSGEASSVEAFDDWVEGELRRLDAALPHCEANGLYVVLDLHSPPGGKVTAGGYVGSDDRLFTDPACQTKFVEFWRRTAARYKDAKAIWGYDLVNEPVEGLVEEGCDDWQGLAERAARAIRAVDPNRAIIVEPAAWGGPDGLAGLVPLSVSNVVYSVHMYLPHAFTHQGVHNAGPEYVYPGMIDGKVWDKTKLEAALQPVVDFQRHYGVHIFIGEFSAIRWAPDNSAHRYLKDLIEIFEARDWDWTYHAFREWSGWSVEHGSDRGNTARVSPPPERQQLLREWFSRNKKPSWTEPR